MDFAADPEAVAAVVEAHRLTYGHLFNSAFAIETSLIDPLPHQRIAVYERMLNQAPLRFLLADDAGAGKTIMTGLYVREMLSTKAYPSHSDRAAGGAGRELGAGAADAFPAAVSHCQRGGRARGQPLLPGPRATA